ncbi:hypothetical protein OJ996_12210 [Luteolibacter sp. GHJ8]|uniref:Uncharacterized protein n=1 Tax=Luteolibacter rhizosphaerae TaxID=2989719 RepID=A0ABT3G3C5_9BACT|nr:hypothetical protein [Luteolibacter rhizosphaerae]MCW1914344.1 hypothetical protein [Luteolibacter rhizosphaerae]
MSLLLAIAIWFLIKRHLEGTGEYYAPGQRPPKAYVVPEQDQP